VQNNSKIDYSIVYKIQNNTMFRHT